VFNQKGLINHCQTNKRLNQSLIVTVLICLLSLLNFSAFAQQALDPTKPFTGSKTVSSVKKKAKLNLQSIIWMNDNKLVVINDKTLKIGDVISGYKVVEIKSRSVVLNSTKGLIELAVFSKVVVK